MHDGSCLGIGKNGTAKLFEVHLFLSEEQTVPGWRSFIKVVHSCVPVQKNIGLLSHDRWLSSRVQHCVHSHEECAMHDGTPYLELQCHYD